MLLNEDEDFENSYLYEGVLKTEGVEVKMTLADKNDDPPEEYSIVINLKFTILLNLLYCSGLNVK